MMAMWLLLFFSFFAEFSFLDFQKDAETLVQEMTLEEKVGQMLLPTYDLLAKDKGPNTIEEGKAAWAKEKDLYKLGVKCGLDGIDRYHLGGVLQAGNPLIFSGDEQSRANWKKLADMTMLFYSGPAVMLLGTDAIHGDQHIPGTILFPHNIGLGATHDPQLVKEVAYWTGRDVETSGFNWSFMPTVAIAHDMRWGRSYESFGQIPNVVKELSEKYVEGLQNVVNGSFQGVLATAKHFIGDGATLNGQDEGYSYMIDHSLFWKENGQGYEGAILGGVGSVMASYSSLNDIPMHFGGPHDMLLDWKNRAFQGFVVSDYVGVSRAAYKYWLQHKKKLSYVEAVAKAINAGIDMLMIGAGAYEDPFDYDPMPPYDMRSGVYYADVKTVRDAILEAIAKKLISEEKVDEVVARILKVKLAMKGAKLQPILPEEREKEAKVALLAAEESLVLLKNEKKTLPLTKEDIEHVILLGDYNDIGVQNGGWTINWQGQKGNEFWQEGSLYKKLSFATSIQDGLKLKLKADLIENPTTLSEDLNSENTVAIIAISEPPYAEYMGDVDNDNPWYIKGAKLRENEYMPLEQSRFLGLQFSDEQARMIDLLKERKIKIVTILFSGRPLVITEGAHPPLPLSDAFIAAFLPGTRGGEAIVNALFGDYKFKSFSTYIGNKPYFSNTLPFAWPKNMDEVRNHNPTLFPVGHGLGS